mgnify:CR=1 FL=1
MKHLQNDYQPHLYVQTLGPITQITFAALTHNALRELRIDAETLDLPTEQQIEAIIKQAQQHFIDKQGKLPIFGNIIGYVFCKTARQHYQVDHQSGTFCQMITPVKKPQMYTCNIPYRVVAPE